MWQEKVVEDLKKRDAIEKSQDEFIKLFETAADRAILAEMGIVAAKGGLDQEKELSDLYSELAIKTEKLSTISEEHKSLVTKFDSLEKESKQHRIKAQNYQDETQFKSATVQQLHDEILALQIELNAADQRMEMLEKENIALVDRWMAKVAGEAENLNEANAFIASLNKSQN